MILMEILFNDDVQSELQSKTPELSKNLWNKLNVSRMEIILINVKNFRMLEAH